MFHLTTALDVASGCRCTSSSMRALPPRCAAGHSGGHPDARQAAAGGRAVGVCQHGGRGISDPGDRGLHGAAERSGFMYRNILPCPPGPRKCRPGICRSAGSSRAARPVRFVHPGVDPGLFPFRTWARLQKELLYSSPQLLTHGDAQGTWSCGRRWRTIWRNTGRAVHRRAGGGGCRYGVSAEPAGPAPARQNGGGKPRLPAREAGAGKQRRGVLLPACGCGRPSVEALSGSGAAVCYVTPSHQFPTGVTMPRAAARSCSTGHPLPGPAVYHRGRLRFGVPL